MHVIDRQLLQRHFLGFAQFYDTLHPLPRHHKGGSRFAKLKWIYQGTLSFMPYNS
ncbi:hypothetical protein OKW42_008393 [Paraburkholderia sp. WC7.3d]